jgi:hypothetical protein
MKACRLAQSRWRLSGKKLTPLGVIETQLNSSAFADAKERQND